MTHYIMHSMVTDLFGPKTRMDILAPFEADSEGEALTRFHDFRMTMEQAFAGATARIMTELDIGKMVETNDAIVISRKTILRITEPTSWLVVFPTEA